MGSTSNLEIWCGWIIAPTLGPTRTEADFVAHVEQTVVTDPEAGWIFIVDNLNTHQSESLVLWVAQTCNRTMAKPICWLSSVEPKLANGTG